MTLFLLYLVVFFFGGILLRNVPAGRRALLAVVVSLALALIYYMLERYI